MKIRFQKKEKDPNVVQGVKVPYAPAKRRAAHWRWYLILLIVSSPLLYLLYKMAVSYAVITAQGFISLDKIAVNSSTNGIVESLLIKTGQEVKAGEVVARLYSPDLDVQKRMIEADLSTITNFETQQDRAQADFLYRQLKLTKEVLDNQNEYLRTMTFLFEQGAATLAELAVAREHQSKAQMDYDSALYAKNRYSENQNEETTIPKTQRETEQIRLNSKLQALYEQQARLAQVTQYDGRILDIFTQPGEMLSAGTPILLLGRANKPLVIAYLAPKYAKYARKGHFAKIKLPDGRTLKAVVTENANLTKRLPADLSSPIGSRDLMLLVKLEFLTPLPPVQWVDGLPVTVRFSF